MKGENMKNIRIFNVRIDNLSFKEAVRNIEDYLRGDRLRTIYTPNPEIIMKAREDEKLRTIIEEADMSTADGIGVIYASRIGKKPLAERVTGYDMSMEMLKIANREGYSLYLLGGQEGVSSAARANIERDYPNIKLVGDHNGFFKGSHLGLDDHPEEMAIVEEINRMKPDIIFVGLGFPRQELFINHNKDRIKGKVIIGNGGVMDILAGKAERAPEAWQKLGLEWLYRLIKDPRRIRRQLILPKFMLEVIFKKDAVTS